MITVSDARRYFQSKGPWLYRVTRGCFPELRRDWEAQDEATQNAITLAYANVVACVAQAKIADWDDLETFVKQSLWWAVIHTRAGRSIVRRGRRPEKGGDLYDKGTREEMPSEQIPGHFEDPADLAALRIDFAAFLNDLTERSRLMLLDILCGVDNTHLARKYGVSPGRVSQMRRRFVELWTEFTSL